MLLASAVAAVRNTPATELEPLYEAIDPDLLDALLSSGHHDDSHIQVTFK